MSSRNIMSIMGVRSSMASEAASLALMSIGDLTSHRRSGLGIEANVLRLIGC